MAAGTAETTGVAEVVWPALLVGALVAAGDVVAPALAVGPAVAVGVAYCAATLTRPLMRLGWTLQRYSNEPGVLNVCENVPLVITPESKPPTVGQVVNVGSHRVTVCGELPTHCQVTVSPAVMFESQTPPENDALQK